MALIHLHLFTHAVNVLLFIPHRTPIHTQSSLCKSNVSDGANALHWHNEHQLPDVTRLLFSCYVAIISFLWALFRYAYQRSMSIMYVFPAIIASWKKTACFCSSLSSSLSSFTPQRFLDFHNRLILLPMSETFYSRM